MPTYTIPLVAPAMMLIAAALAFANPGRRPRTQAPLVAEVLALCGLLASLIAGMVLISEGPGSSPLLGIGPLGLSSRLDVVSELMLLLVSFVGWVVLRYSRTYLDGEERQGAFTGWMCLTLASVLLLVQAGNLTQLFVAWVGTSLALHRLLLFYPDRIPAQRAAAKKFVVARLSDGALLGAVMLLASTFGTGDIASILTQASEGSGSASLYLAAGLIAIAALLKSAQFPTHGWLTEVMETPTPVSALLHAGLINAGGFLLVRFADMMLLAPGVLAVLVIVGGFTALYGSCVMLTQPAVKTSLAWSTVAQMGFMTLQCGLGLFPLALLHIVAHSLYKAHAFLGAGGAVELVASIRRPGAVAIPRAGAVLQSFIAALAIYGLIGFAFGLDHKSAQAIVLGAILVLGVAYLLAQGFADAAPRELTRRTALYSVVTAVAYFTLHGAAEWLTSGTLPAPPAADSLEWALMILSVVSFALVAVGQATFPLWAHHPAAAGLRVHLSNGLYVNALFDRMLGGWSTRRPSRPAA